MSKTQWFKRLYRKLPTFKAGERYDAQYEVTGADGIVRLVRRHEWCLPSSHWAWKAEAKGSKTVYGDNLEDLAQALGHQQDPEEARLEAEAELAKLRKALGVTR
jgi:spore cortex formation protein SpoVR/YcgB (stage V sporulation)